MSSAASDVNKREIDDLPKNPDFPIMVYGDPRVLEWMIEWIHGPLGEDQTVLLNPLVFAGWVGIFITALNLLPIGQLDGGHIVHSVLARRVTTFPAPCSVCWPS